MNTQNIKNIIFNLVLSGMVVTVLLLISYIYIYNPLQITYNYSLLQHQPLINSTKDSFKGFVTGSWLSPAGVNLEILLKISSTNITVNNTTYDVIIDDIDIILGIIKLHDIKHNYKFQINKLFEVSGYVISVTFDPRVLSCDTIKNYTETCTRIFYWQPKNT